MTKRKQSEPPLPLTAEVEPWGKVGAVQFKDGERYYMLTDRYGCVSYMPGDVVEQAVRAGRRK